MISRLEYEDRYGEDYIDGNVMECRECGCKMTRVIGDSLEHFGTPCKEPDYYVCPCCD